MQLLRAIAEHRLFLDERQMDLGVNLANTGSVTRSPFSIKISKGTWNLEKITLGLHIPGISLKLQSSYALTSN